MRKDNEIKSEENIKYFYNLLVSNNDLSIFFNDSLGSWEKDKKKFIKYYNENIEFIEAFKNGDFKHHFFYNDFSYLDDDPLYISDEDEI